MLQDPHFVRKCFERGSDGISAAKLGGLEPPSDVLQRRGDHKVLLLQSQLLPFKKLQIKSDQGQIRLRHWVSTLKKKKKNNFF